jgi:DNA-binding NtrC family response regulator
LQHAVLVSSGPELRPEHLPEPIRSLRARTLLAALSRGEATPVLAESRGESERQQIERALTEAGHSRSRAAYVLGISRVTLYKKMKKYGLMESPTSCGSVPVEESRLRLGPGAC